MGDHDALCRSACASDWQRSGLRAPPLRARPQVVVEPSGAVALAAVLSPDFRARCDRSVVAPPVPLAAGAASPLSDCATFHRPCPAGTLMRRTESLRAGRLRRSSESGCSSAGGTSTFERSSRRSMGVGGLRRRRRRRGSNMQRSRRRRKHPKERKESRSAAGRRRNRCRRGCKGHKRTLRRPPAEKHHDTELRPAEHPRPRKEPHRRAARGGASTPLWGDEREHPTPTPRSA